MKLFISIILLLSLFQSWEVGSVRIENREVNKARNSESAIDWNDDFTGLWINIDLERPGITKCKIRFEDKRYFVQMWGSCEPTDCDWGETASEESSIDVARFQLLWSKVPFAVSTITYEIIDGKLKLTNKRHFKDNSGRPDYTLVEYFSKQ